MKPVKVKLKKGEAQSLVTFDYKNLGHRYIDRLVELGIHRNEVYLKMSKRLRMSREDCHFAKTNSDAELYAMVMCLKAMVEGKEKQRDQSRVALTRREERQRRKIQDLENGVIPKPPVMREQVAKVDKSVFEELKRRNETRHVATQKITSVDSTQTSDIRQSTQKHFKTVYGACTMSLFLEPFHKLKAIFFNKTHSVDSLHTLTRPVTRGTLEVDESQVPGKGVIGAD